MNITELFPELDNEAPTCEVCDGPVPVDDWICAKCFLAITPPEGNA